jgi:uncharacterized membrane protein
MTDTLFPDLTPTEVQDVCRASRSRRMCLNPDQREVIRLIRERGRLTLAEAVQCFGHRLYRNAEAHIGRRLARMVNRGLIVRIKPGVFALPNNRATRGEAVGSTDC